VDDEREAEFFWGFFTVFFEVGIAAAADAGRF
jgi:hypothetical protein